MSAVPAPAGPVEGDFAQLRIAIVHPFLISQGGGEKVIDALATLFPQAEVFTLLLDRASLSPALQGRVIQSTFLDRIPGAHRRYQQLSPLYDRATATHDLRGFDIVISSGGPGAKTARVPPGTLHIHYCHSPVRYLWDQYATWIARLPFGLRQVFALSARAQRRRDHAAAQRVDLFVANSDYIAARIRRFYGRESTTIHPPVEIRTALPPPGPRGDFYLSLGRLVPGKRTDLLIEACNRLGRKLVVAGTGPELERLRALAGATVSVEGRVSDARRDDLFGSARAFLFAADEDFGIATVEAQSWGLPSIAYAHGGSLEILADGDAVMFAEQEVAVVIDAIQRFEAIEADFDREAIHARAERFSEARFAKKIVGAVRNAYLETDRRN